VKLDFMQADPKGVAGGAHVEDVPGANPMQADVSVNISLAAASQASVPVH